MHRQEKQLFLSIELSKREWKLCFGDGKQERQVTIDAGRVEWLLKEVARAKAKFGLPADAPVASCYEAGRDGFWLDRELRRNGIDNIIVDPASIEVPRRARRRKTDRLDAVRLLRLLLRARLWGETRVFSVVAVPSEEQEARMRIGRNRERLVKERTGHRARIRSLLALHGIVVKNQRLSRVEVDKLRGGNGRALPPEAAAELRREQERLKLVEKQVRELEAQQIEAIGRGGSAADRKAGDLCRLKGIGPQGGWVLGHEVFGWRQFRNRKQVGSFAGLTGTPYDSGETLREQGISKAGSRRVRAAMIEMAWNWVRFQPGSALAKWFMENYGSGASRSRRKGIVALARKLLVALWKYVEQGATPEGALFKA